MNITAGIVSDMSKICHGPIISSNAFGQDSAWFCMVAFKIGQNSAWSCMVALKNGRTVLGLVSISLTGDRVRFYLSCGFPYKLYPLPINK